MSEEKKTQVSRRTLAKGAAWSVPALSISAAANAASTSAPACPTCVKPVFGAMTGQVIAGALLGAPEATGAFVMGGSFNLDSSACDVRLFRPAYSINVTNIELSWSDGVVQNSSTDPGLGAGTFGAISNVSYAPAAFPIRNFPYDTVDLVIDRYTPVAPTQICISMLMIVFGLPGLVRLQCPQQVCFPVTSTGLGSIVRPIFGVVGGGTVNYTSLLVGD